MSTKAKRVSEIEALPLTQMMAAPDGRGVLDVGARHLVEQAEALVRELLVERAQLAQKVKAIDDAIANVKGSLRSAQRVQKTLADLAKGADYEIVDGPCAEEG